MKTNIQVLKRHFVTYHHGTSYILSDLELVRFVAVYAPRCKHGEVMAFVRIGDLSSGVGRRKESSWPAILMNCDDYNKDGHYTHGLRSLYGYSNLTIAITCSFYTFRDGPVVSFRLFDKKGRS
jgi:hypothetical protein